jgi:hypothetical protein
MECIHAQGMMGMLTTLNTGDVAEYTLNKALYGRAVVIPGIINQFLKKASSLIPETWIARILQRQWSRVLLKRCHTLRPQGNICGTPRWAAGEGAQHEVTSPPSVGG